MNEKCRAFPNSPSVTAAHLSNVSFQISKYTISLELDSQGADILFGKQKAHNRLIIKNATSKAVISRLLTCNFSEDSCHPLTASTHRHKIKINTQGAKEERFPA